jgi:hypothetical protein
VQLGHILERSFVDQTRAPAAGADDASGTAFRARAQASHRAAAVVRGKAEAAERDALEALSATRAGSP